MRRSYRSARRHRWSRYEPSPVLLVTEDDRTLVVGSAARMLWRYRSELAPVAVGLCLAVLGRWGHGRHPGWAWAVLAVTLALAALLGVPPSRWTDVAGGVGRLIARWLSRWAVYSRAPERVYAAAIVFLAGSWLAAATRWGPGTPPLPTVWLLGILAGGVPWWTHRRRRARVRVARTIEAWPTFAESAGLPGSRLVSAVVDRWGWTGRLALRRGQTTTQAIAAAPGVESALGVRPGAVRIEPDPDRADRAILRVVEKDPLARPVLWHGNPASEPSILDPVDLGVFEDGSSVLVRLAYRNALVGGAIGSGKSGVLNVLMAHLIACRDVAVWGVDLKGGMELAPWSSCLGRLATTPAASVALVRDALAVRDHRTANARARLWDPAQDGPALVLVVDEYAELPGEAKALLDSLARLGRAVMVNVLAATQRPTQDAMGGGATRSQMEVRIALRVRERRDVDLILDRGAWAAGWRADQLDAPGKLLLSVLEHSTPRPARGYLITDQEVAHTAAAYAGRQPVVPLPPDSPSAEGDPVSAEEPASAPSTGPDADRLLWDALTAAGAEGITVPALVIATGLSRPTVYRRLNAYATAGRAEQAAWGRWRTLAAEGHAE